MILIIYELNLNIDKSNLYTSLLFCIRDLIIKVFCIRLLLLSTSHKHFIHRTAQSLSCCGCWSCIHRLEVGIDKFIGLVGVFIVKALLLLKLMLLECLTLSQLIGVIILVMNDFNLLLTLSSAIIYRRFNLIIIFDLQNLEWIRSSLLMLTRCRLLCLHMHVLLQYNIVRLLLLREILTAH